MNGYKNDIITKIKEFVSIESVETEALPNMPFGKGVAEALDYALGLARSFGFNAVNYDNYVGEVEWGEGSETLGILCHVDVVPAGKLSAWKYPPFTATEEDGKIFGRGTMDDKAPAIICLYAMKRLKDEGFIPKQKIKLILGCDEESGWLCMEHYKKVAKMPDYGFSPDGSFPVIHAEKGILHLKFKFPCNTFLTSMIGGERPNMVCDECMALAPTPKHSDNFKLTLLDGKKAVYTLPVNKKFANEFKLEVHADGTVVARGKSAHGSTPEKGENAILPILLYLESIDAINSEIRKIFFDDCLGLTKLSDETGSLTMCPGMIKKGFDGRDDLIELTVDIRYPCTYKVKEVLGVFDKAGLKYTVLSHQEPLYVERKNPLVKTLLSIYNDVTGKHAEPIAIGGGTYARALPLGVAFGPEPEDEVATVHEPNEYISIKCIEQTFEIYTRTIKELTR
ncbi:MAG: Sapep family Mn(2+)-dependent dipeptidase [Clostridia bacterium]|nr:Sapep family Mn(2+)-dependent dipeptidase [Clostridia bacterium]